MIKFQNRRSGEILSFDPCKQAHIIRLFRTGKVDADIGGWVELLESAERRKLDNTAFGREFIGTARLA